MCRHRNDWAARFAAAAFATLYLAPYNYHRIHMPLAGTLRAAWYVPGSCTASTRSRPVRTRIVRAERARRVHVRGRTPGYSPWCWWARCSSAAWPRSGTARSLRAARGRGWNCRWMTRRAPLRLAKGAEMGRFNMGSTVILLLPPDMIDWLPSVQARATDLVGQTLARARSARMPSG